MIKTMIKCVFLSMLSFSILSCNTADVGVQNSATDLKLDELHVYVKTSPYSRSIKKCIQARNSFSSCKIEELDFIGKSELDVITIKDIMNRVLVSHSWMGERFEDLLKELPVAALQLFKPITMIAIGSDIRPSFYTEVTGAIYIDPDYLYLSEDEFETISDSDDFRSNFGDELLFKQIFTYLKGSELAFSYERNNIQDLMMRFSRLLFHELAHANDFLPVKYLGTLEKDDSVYEALQKIYGESNRISQLIYGLSSTEMLGLAKVRFVGKVANDQQKRYTASDIGEFIEDDVANNFYNYTSVYEDLAMMSEAVLMKYFYQLDKMFSFVDNVDINTCDLDVKWGNLNRIASPLLKNRAKFYVANVFPYVSNSKWDEFFIDDIGNSTQFSGKFPWCLDTNSLKSNKSRRTTEDKYKLFKGSLK